MSKRTLTVSFLAAGLTAGVLATAVGPAGAQTNSVGGSGSTYFISGAVNQTGVAQKVYAFGNADDDVLYGDWYGTGEDLPLVRRGNAFILPEPGNPNRTATTFSFGDRGDVVLAGDWDGDGVDSLAVRRGNHYFVKNDFTTGKADADFYYGDANDVVLAGNWDGQVAQGVEAGIDNSVPADGDYNDPGTPARAADIKPVDDPGYNANPDDGYTDENGVVHQDYTQPGDRAPGTGVDNNKDGDFDDAAVVAIPADVPPGQAKGDTLMIQRGNQFFVKNSITTGKADYTFYFGDRGDNILVGDWATNATFETKDASAMPAASGNGADQLAVQRGNQFFKSSELEAARVSGKNPTTIESFYFGDKGDRVFVAGLPTELTDRQGNYVAPETVEGGPVADNADTEGNESSEIVGDGFGVRR